MFCFCRPLMFKPTLSPGLASSTRLWCISTVNTLPSQGVPLVWVGKKITSSPGLTMPCSTRPAKTSPTPANKPSHTSKGQIARSQRRSQQSTPHADPELASPHTLDLVDAGNGHAHGGVGGTRGHAGHLLQAVVQGDDGHLVTLDVGDLGTVPPGHLQRQTQTSTARHSPLTQQQPPTTTYNLQHTLAHTSSLSTQRTFSDFLNRLSPIQPEMGMQGVELATKSFFQPTLHSMFFISLAISV